MSSAQQQRAQWDAEIDFDTVRLMRTGLTRAEAFERAKSLHAFRRQRPTKNAPESIGAVLARVRPDLLSPRPRRHGGGAR